MKKVIMAMLAAAFLMIALPVMPQAHASSIIEDKLTELAAQNTSLPQEDLIKIKQGLAQGNKDVIWPIIAKAALAKAGGSDTAATAAIPGDLNVVASALRQRVEQGIGEKIAPYQQQLTALAALLNSQGILTPQAAKDNNSLAGAPQHYNKMLQMTSTAYGPGVADNGRWNDKTYLGGKVRRGVVAVDPSVIPLGSKLWIEGYGAAVAEDEGSAIKGNRIDLAFNNRQDALDYGIKNVKVYVLN